MSLLPPQDNQQVQVAPPSDDQATVMEALKYLDQAQAKGEASPTVQEYAAKIALDARNFIERMKNIDHAHQERMIRTAGEMQMRQRMADAQTQIYIRESHERLMASLRQATGKGDIGAQLTKQAIDFTFDFLRSKF